MTLFPIHALGLRTLHQKKKQKKNDDEEGDNTKDTEFIAYDQDADGHLFTPNNDNNNQQGAGLRLKLNIPLDKTQPAYLLLGRHTNRHVLFSMFLPEKDVQQGWLGGRMKAASSQHDKVGNCITLPLPGAAPLCGVVATKDIMEGEEIISTASLQPKVMDELKGLVASQYKRELSTLQMYIEAACETATQQQSEQLSSSDGSDGKQEDNELGPFHQLNEQYPGLQRIHSNPDIYAIDNFLTDTECDRLIVKSQPHLVPCLVKNDKNGKVEQDAVRTSTNTNVPQAEVPSIVEKMTNVACCNADQLEILQVLNYKRGQEFIPHTDGFSGKFDACGFEQGSRQATIFCYLNDVATGGATNFPELGLSIQPKKGMAVIHFPADVNLREDKRTLHQGSPAIDEKWLLTTWVWSKARSDEMYDESKLPPLSSDVI